MTDSSDPFIHIATSVLTLHPSQTSKGGSSTLFGDYRPPINEGVDERDQQARVTGVSLCTAVLLADLVVNGT